MLEEPRALWRQDGVYRQVTSSGDAPFVGTVLIQVFTGNLGLCGLTCALILSQMECYCDHDNNLCVCRVFVC